MLKCLAEELLYMQDKNGHFWQYDVPRDHPYYGAESTIAPGEFIFALSRLYSHYKDKKYKEAVDRALPWYMKAWRKLLSERTPEGVFDEEHRVNLIGIVPWLVTAMNDLHLTTGEQKYADIAFEQQDWIDDEYFWYLNRADASGGRGCSEPGPSLIGPSDDSARRNRSESSGLVGITARSANAPGQSGRVHSMGTDQEGASGSHG